MTMIGIGSFLLGAVFGLRFRVFVLFPAALLGLLIVAAMAAIGAVPLLSATWVAAVFVVALQFGFLGGLFVRFVVAMARVRAPAHIPSSVVRS
jgi:hypothetical protein